LEVHFLSLSLSLSLPPPGSALFPKAFWVHTELYCWIVLCSLQTFLSVLTIAG
jgi:hypothetical protein